jgi:hypothetical protein
VEKLVVLVKKGALMETLLYVLLKLFVAKIVNKRLLCSFDGAKAFVLEHTNNPFNI